MCVCVCVCVCVRARVCMALQSCPTPCDPMDSSIHGILQARILERVAMPSSRGIFPTQGLNLYLSKSLALADRCFTTSATWEAPDNPIISSKSFTTQ